MIVTSEWADLADRLRSLDIDKHDELLARLRRIVVNSEALAALGERGRLFLRLPNALSAFSS